jgi:hypothetical protein
VRGLIGAICRRLEAAGIELDGGEPPPAAAAAAPPRRPSMAARLQHEMREAALEAAGMASPPQPRQASGSGRPAVADRLVLTIGNGDMCRVVRALDQVKLTIVSQSQGGTVVAVPLACRHLARSRWCVAQCTQCTPGSSRFRCRAASRVRCKPLGVRLFGSKETLVHARNTCMLRCLDPPTDQLSAVWSRTEGAAWPRCVCRASLRDARSLL